MGVLVRARFDVEALSKDECCFRDDELPATGLCAEGGVTSWSIKARVLACFSRLFKSSSEI
jgi:hypothetical protein